MRSLSDEVLEALASGRCVPRDFIWAVARERDTGDEVADGQWSGIGPIDAQVIEPDTQSPVTRRFYGSGTLTQVHGISLVAIVQVQTATIRMSQVNDRVNALLRQYNLKQGRIEIYRGLLSHDTGLLVAPAFCRFVGFADEAPIFTPAQNGDGGYVELRCKSHTQELLKGNADLRSDASQQRRLDGDRFYQHVTTVGNWEQFQGRNAGRVPSTAGAG